MSFDSDPPRLSDFRSEGPPELRKLFEQARRDVPNDAELGGLLARLGPVVGAGALAASDALRSAGSQVGTSSGSALSMAKLFGGLATVGVVAAGLAWFAANHDQAAPASVPSAPERAAQVRLEPEPKPVENQAAIQTASVSAPVAVVSAPRAGQPSSAVPADNVAAEARLLERAREAIDTNPKQALALAKEHAARFPRGVLAQEREVITIDALRRLGRAGDADSRAAQFKKVYPGSAHQLSVDPAKPQPR